MYGPLLDCKKNPEHANLLGTLTIHVILSIPVSIVAQHTSIKRKRICSCVCFELQSSAKQFLLYLLSSVREEFPKQVFP